MYSYTAWRAHHQEQCSLQSNWRRRTHTGTGVWGMPDKSFGPPLLLPWRCDFTPVPAPFRFLVSHLVFCLFSSNPCVLRFCRCDSVEFVVLVSPSPFILPSERSVIGKSPYRSTFRLHLLMQCLQPPARPFRLFQGDPRGSPICANK